MMMAKTPLLNWRNALAFAHDTAAAGIAWTLAYLLRFNLVIPPEYIQLMWRDAIWVIPVQAGIFLLSGMYQGLWRYASLADLRRIIICASLGSVAILVVLAMTRMPTVPRSVILLYPLLLSVSMGGSRILFRTIKEGRFLDSATTDTKSVIVVGSGDVAERLLREIKGRPGWHIAGILDSDRTKHGRHIHGIKVLGTIDRIPDLAQTHTLSHLILATQSATYAERRNVVDLASKAGLSVLTIPSVDELVTGRFTVSQVRQVNLEDLLGRAPVVLDKSKLGPFLEARVVLVTGAGGSIGSELCRQIALYNPSRLVLLDVSEFALYSIEKELQTKFSTVPLICAIGDAKDAARVSEIFANFRPEVVFHAAAYKHVPLMELNNAWQCVTNNVLSSWVVASAARRYRAKKFVMISTDKAVNPTNVMGASKRLSEMICHAAGEDDSANHVVVRFGNVLGSTGSVIPRFREQIAMGGPVTVTHPEVTRYFMSIPEACQLVLQAGAMGKGGEIFVLDMGEPVRILDLARDMIRLSGMNPEDIRILFTGLRPGEKLYEELLADDENTLPTPHAKLRIARARRASTEKLEEVLAWVKGGKPQSDADVREKLRYFVPEYESAGHSEEDVRGSAREGNLKIISGGKPSPIREI